MGRRKLHALGALILVIATTAFAKFGGFGPYVVAVPDGFMYAKAVPTDPAGTKGTTRIFRVTAKEDELLDTYDWYAPVLFGGGITLGWSPIAGKVAVMRVHAESEPTADTRVELSFYLGGKRLLTYSTKDLLAMGFKKQQLKLISDQRRLDTLDIKVIGCQQVPRTNDYHFVIATADGTPIHFDILTGERVPIVDK
jgi:hypothetical protein